MGSDMKGLQCVPVATESLKAGCTTEIGDIRGIGGLVGSGRRPPPSADDADSGSRPSSCGRSHAESLTRGGTRRGPVPDREWPRDFKDRLTSPLPSRRDIWKILRAGGFRNTAIKLEHAKSIPRGDGKLPGLRGGQASVTWVGHATFLVRLGGLNILTDPVWSERLPGRSRRMSPPGIAWDDLPKIDAVVISHNHYDHQDKPTLRRLPRDTHLFVPGASAPWFRKLGFANVTELDWWESAAHGGVTFDFVPAHHWSRRGVRDICRHLWGGWVLTAGKRRVYFAGDTGYGHWFKEIGQRYPNIDVALMPIGAYAPRWFMRPVHTDPDEAIRATSDLGARNMACMHWGTFVLTQEPLMEPLDRVRVAWGKTGRPREQLWDLAVGETRILAPQD